VFAWQTGYPTRVSYARGYPEYDPYHYSTERLLASGEADALLWVSSINGRLTPPEAAVPTIVIGRSGMTFEREPDIYIPVGAPGIDHAGHMYRCDNVVSLPLRKLRDSGLPSGAEVLAAIEEAL
jgi:formylmethanofuran dehydrogenase subunit B